MIGGRFSRPPPLPEAVAREIRSVVQRLRDDKAHALAMWSLHRSMAPIFEALECTWHEQDVDVLLALEPGPLVAADAFFREVERFRIWLCSTEPMSATLEARYEAALQRLELVAAEALVALGQAPLEAPSDPWETRR